MVQRVSEGRPDGAVGIQPADNGVAAVVRIRCFRHEGIVVVGHQRVRGLGRLAATWELSLSDGSVLTAPAALPDLRPGETAAVPMPLRLPADGGEVWLTLRVVTAEDRAKAPRGTAVCAPRIRLRAAAEAEAEPPEASGSGRPRGDLTTTGLTTAHLTAAGLTTAHLTAAGGIRYRPPSR